MFFLEKCHQLTQEDDVLSGPEHGLPKHKTQIIHKTMEHAIISPTMRRQYCIYIYYPVLHKINFTKTRNNYCSSLGKQFLGISAESIFESTT